jgi:hypothetical protein
MPKQTAKLLLALELPPILNYTKEENNREKMKDELKKREADGSCLTTDSLSPVWQYPSGKTTT